MCSFVLIHSTLCLHHILSFFSCDLCLHFYSAWLAGYVAMLPLVAASPAAIASELLARKTRATRGRGDGRESEGMNAFCLLRMTRCRL